MYVFFVFKVVLYFLVKEKILPGPFPLESSDYAYSTLSLACMQSSFRNTRDLASKSQHQDKQAVHALYVLD